MLRSAAPSAARTTRGLWCEWRTLSPLWIQVRCVSARMGVDPGSLYMLVAVVGGVVNLQVGLL